MAGVSQGRQELEETFGHKHRLKIVGTTKYFLLTQCRDCANRYEWEKFLVRRLVMGDSWYVRLYGRRMI